MRIASFCYLAAAGEYSMHIHCICWGVSGRWRTLVQRLERTAAIPSPRRGQTLGACRMLTTSAADGTGGPSACIRARSLSCSALHPAALEQYLALTGGHRFSGSACPCRQRNHRVAETVAMCHGGRRWSSGPTPTAAAAETGRSRQVVPEYACFYPARSVKQLDRTEMSKTIFTRVTGCALHTRLLATPSTTRETP